MNINDSLQHFKKQAELLREIKPMKKLCILFIITIFSISLFGCGASYIQAIDGYATAAATTARDAEDLNLKRLKFGICATPFSAVVRNPEFAGAIKELCLGNSKTTAGELLNSVEGNK